MLASQLALKSHAMTSHTATSTTHTMTSRTTTSRTTTSRTTTSRTTTSRTTAATRLSLFPFTQAAWRTQKRVKGIEPSSIAWKAMALPLSYTRRGGITFVHENNDDLFQNAAALTPTLISQQRHGKTTSRTFLQQTHVLFIAAISLHGNRAAGTIWGVQDSNLRRQCHQIYSLTPLTARETPPGMGRSPSVFRFEGDPLRTPFFQFYLPQAASAQASAGGSHTARRITS